MTNVIDWLDQRTIIARRMSDGSVIRESVAAFERLAELIAVNGGKTKVDRVGTIVKGGIYGRVGLTLEEAFDLINLHGVLAGFIICLDDPAMAKAAQDKIHAEIIRVKKEGFRPGRDVIAKIEPPSEIVIADEHDMKEMLKSEEAVSKKIRTKE